MATVMINGRHKAAVREGLMRVVTGTIEFSSRGDADIIKITDDVAEAVQYLVRFYRNYHSARFVDARLVIRLAHSPTDAELATLNTEFADIVLRGALETIEPTQPEINDNDHLDLARLAFRFDRHSWARLHVLIEALNELPSLG
ncbi:MAG TPA: hypothetical protein VF327_04495 [Gaiellaceae bacterium]